MTLLAFLSARFFLFFYFRCFRLAFSMVYCVSFLVIKFLLFENWCIIFRCLHYKMLINQENEVVWVPVSIADCLLWYVSCEQTQNCYYFISGMRSKDSVQVFFWSVFSPNAGKYGPEMLQIQTFFTLKW